MIKKLLGLESPIIEKLNEKHGKDVGTAWKISNLSIRLAVMGIILAMLMLILAALASILAMLMPIITVASRDLTMLSVLPIAHVAVFILIISGFGLILFSISTGYVAYKMNETFWAILCIVAIVFNILPVVPILLVVPIILLVFFKNMKTQELLNEKIN